MKNAEKVNEPPKDLQEFLKRTIACLDDDSRRLLSVTSVLPAGIAMRDVHLFVSADALQAASTLRKNSLAELRGDRLMCPSAILESIGELCPPYADDIECITHHYFNLVQQCGSQLGKRGGGEARERIEPEIESVIRLIEMNYESNFDKFPTELCESVGNLIRFTCCGNPEILLKLATSAEQSGNALQQAECLQAYAAVLTRKSNYLSAIEQFASARKLFTSLGDSKGQADCLFGAALCRESLTDAQSSRNGFEEALEIYIRLGCLNDIAGCDIQLARINGHAKKIDLANDQLIRAKDMANELDDIWRLAQAHSVRADLAGLTNSIEESILERGRAVAMFEETGDGNALLGLGNVAYKRCEYPRARELYAMALDQFSQADARYSMGIAHKSLARTSDSRLEFNRHNDAARELLASTGCSAAASALDKMKPMRRRNPALKFCYRAISKVLGFLDL